MTLTADLREAEPGQTFVTRCGPITTRQLVRYAGASGDFNPIHYDHFYAVEAKLGGVIAHGMLTMAFMGRALTDRIGATGRIARISARFTSPVRPGDTVVVTADVTGRRSGMGGPEIDCTLKARIEDRVVAEGRSTVSWPPATNEPGQTGEANV